MVKRTGGAERRHALLTPTTVAKKWTEVEGGQAGRGGEKQEQSRREVGKERRSVHGFLPNAAAWSVLLTCVVGPA